MTAKDVTEEQVRSALASGLAEVTFTVTQKKIMQVLADGERVDSYELLDCLGDPLYVITNLQDHLSDIRNKIRPHGFDILCEYRERRTGYRCVLTLAGLYLLTKRYEDFNKQRAATRGTDKKGGGKGAPS